MNEYKLSKESYYNGKYIDTLSYKIIAKSKDEALEWAKIDGWIQLKDNDKYIIEEVNNETDSKSNTQGIIPVQS